MALLHFFYTLGQRVNIMRVLLYFLMIILMNMGVGACSSDQNTPIHLDEMLDCHRSVTWDSASVHTALLGEWEWEYIACALSSYENNSDYRGIRIIFQSNGSYQVLQGNTEVSTDSYEIVPDGADFFRLEPQPDEQFLDGRLTFCDDRLVFYGSHEEGCDHYYVRY
jgi:hypothetical protein